ncbi:hypothetical protein JMJ35_003328 [Cladonia borealis]|uniref:Uncharacterized protein n=1 Tax=Cladonia borealis TaxID=184061 RepID=A0AA39R606_9LECA|nr:hypothetical protein JMJ35_003328 [Cladonia borealis]
MASLSSLLTTLTDSLTSATASLPDNTTLAPPPEGISLLDLKSELLLSYLHNLTFLILLKLRSQTPNPTTNTPDETSQDTLTIAVTHKLIELRIYLEKGVRPLESRLKYQLDKLLLAAAEEASTTTPPIPETSSTKTLPPPSTTPALSHRPNPSAFARPSQPSNPITDTKAPTGPYRPPRIHPTTLPPPSKSKNPTKPHKSSLLSTFISEEMTTAPTAEPSIGAGSFLKGKAREREEERRNYEEMRLVRLPEDKKEKGKGKRRRDGGGEDLLGGLDFGGDFGELKGGGKGKRRKGDGDGGGERVGERWERRVGRGVGRKRR